MAMMIQRSAHAPVVRCAPLQGAEGEAFPLPLGGQEWAITFPPEGALVRQLTLDLTGGGYSGTQLVRDWHVSVTAGQESGQFVLDFHRPLAIDQVAVTGCQVTVYPWLGVAFDKEPVKGPVLAQKLQVQATQANGQALDLAGFQAGLQLSCSSHPTNVRLMIKGQPPCFFHPGELTGRVAVPDFSAEVNRYQEAARATGQVPERVELLIQSDTPGDLTVAVAPVGYSLTCPVELGGNGEAGITLEPGQPVELPLRIVTDGLPLSATLTGVTLEVAGELADERLAVARTASADPTGVGVMIFPLIAAAQPLSVGRDLTATGVHLRLSGDQEPAILQVELRGDAGGTPGTEILAAGTAEVKAGAAPAWTEVQWSRPAALVRGAAYWLLLRSTRGQAVWEAMAMSKDEPGLSYTRDDGLTWRSQALPAGESAVGQFKLIYLPDALRPAAALELGLLAGGELAARAALTPAVAAQPVRLQAELHPCGVDDLVLRLEPAAAGRLHLGAGRAEVTIEGGQGSGSDG